MSRRGLEDRLQVLVEPGVDNTPRKNKPGNNCHAIWCVCVCMCACVRMCVRAAVGTILDELSQVFAATPQHLPCLLVDVVRVRVRVCMCMHVREGRSWNYLG